MLAEPPTRGGYFSLVNQLRGAAALLVVWDHLVGQWLAQRGLQWAPSDLVERFVLGPLNLIQHAGFLGVALFFLISGFVVTRAAAREDGRTFVLRRLTRVYPPLVAAVLLAVAVAWAQAELGMGSEAWDALTPAAVLKAMTLVTYVSVPQVVVVGVAWTLVIELVFYAMLWAVGPLLKSARPDWLATVVILAVVVAVGLLGRSLGDGFFLLSVSVSYVPVLVVGHVVYLVSQRRTPVWVGGLLALAAWLVFVWGVERTQPTFLTPESSYGSSLSVALLLFVLAVLCEGRIRPARWVDVVAARSYTLYLVHGIVGLFVLDVVTREGVAYRWALLAALIATAAVTEGFYRAVERPSISLGRRLTRSRRDTAGGTPSAHREPEPGQIAAPV
uniref:acyltransferase family protein n=1 Tax=Cellulomonas hominis TaxID=156981 RepID=UPI0018ABFEC3|nr:acyltransferase [Cellulomonas hominis]